MKIIITVLRAAIGWHFLYEGLIKLFADKWSAASYLNNTYGFLSGFYHWLTTSPMRMEAVDLLNVWGLILIGLALFVGLCVRWTSIAGALLLTLYYFAYPPFGISLFGGDGTVYIINPLFIEATVLVFLFFYKEKGYGLDNLMPLLKKKKQVQVERTHALPDTDVNSQREALKGRNHDSMSEVTQNTSVNSRREALKELVTLPVLGLFGWEVYRNSQKYGTDAISGSTIVLNRRSLVEIEGTMPMGILVKGKPPVSRLIMGTNHLSGNAHARDLKYANSLFKAYNTDKKIIETYMLAEQAGMNLFFATPLLDQYKKMFGGNFQTWLNVSPTKDDIYGPVDKAIDRGVDYIFIQGAALDRRAHDGELEVVVKCMEYIQRQGYPAGLGAHTIQAMIEAADACQEAGIEPDFYYKTMHHDKYWSAHPRENRKPYLWSANISEDHNEFHDNMWCLFPEETVAFVQKVKKPVVGFKVLAGGALLPNDGFQWAFDNGADFIEVGMFDFQIVENVIQTIQSVEKAQNRIRAWS